MIWSDLTVIDSQAWRVDISIAAMQAKTIPPTAAHGVPRTGSR
jgi:hypothetical protein